ncbi:hypothetical protein HPG69_006052 [Diceros bicornis minor]|uniref:Immunoglobulin V-set domain-containing protein n=1 Tax=Diceros bicornis minor TaxID=77932 RepID=A0A7J7EUF7_DICBM|nr:hypothetical protein HPG69_006052 [Diceros bicornis minor]
MRKYWYKSSCSLPWREKIVETTESEREERSGHGSIRDHPANLTFTVTLERVTEDDEGTYWCGIDASWLQGVLRDPVFQVVVSVFPGEDSPPRTSTRAARVWGWSCRPSGKTPPGQGALGEGAAEGPRVLVRSWCGHGGHWTQAICPHSMSDLNCVSQSPTGDGGWENRGEDTGPNVCFSLTPTAVLSPKIFTSTPGPPMTLPAPSWSSTTRQETLDPSQHHWSLLSSVHFLLLVFLEVPLLLSMLGAVLWVNRPQRSSGGRRSQPNCEHQ